MGTGQPLNRCAQSILKALETGGRSANVFSGLARNQKEFEQAIGQLFLAGRVLWKGKTSGRLLVLNGRRTG